MTRKARTDPDLAEMERQDAEAYACQPQDPKEVVEWRAIQDWGETDMALADTATPDLGQRLGRNPGHLLLQHGEALMQAVDRGIMTT